MNNIACQNMITQQLKTGDVEAHEILSIFNNIPREDFVPEQFKNFAYSDMQIPLSNKQLMFTPLEEASLLKALDLKGHETVCEIGTGTGFLTCCLAQFAKKVISIEYYEEFSNQAREKLKRHNCNNVELITGDGINGWVDKAPYDVLVFTGALDKITEIQKLQILFRGKLFAIVGSAPIMPGILYSLDEDDRWNEQLVFETNTPHLINKYKPKEFVF